VASELTAKRLELYRELVPGTKRVAVLVNAELAERTLRDIEHAARAMEVQIQIFNATTGREIDAVFANLGRDRPGVGRFRSRREGQDGGASSATGTDRYRPRSGRN
jgi:hypothetical protein